MTEITAHHGLFKDTKLHVDDTGPAPFGITGSIRAHRSSPTTSLRSMQSSLNDQTPNH